MTDITKYKNVSLSHKTYDLIDKIRKVIQPDTVLSRSQTISILVNEKARKLNGKIEKSEERILGQFFSLKITKNGIIIKRLII